MSAPDICFLHIHKTAGTSFGELIRKAYKAEEILPARDCPELSRFSREEFNR